MKFIWPVMLVWLLMIPLFVAVYVRLQRQRRRLVTQYGALGLGLGQAASLPPWRRHLPRVLFLIALTVLIVALARPETDVTLPQREATVMLAFDISGSMAADDVKPSRLDAAKQAARNLVAKQPPTVQIGVVTFSDGGFATQAPTTDQTAVLNAINRLSVQRSTSLGSGIDSALQALVLIDRREPLTLSESTPTPTPVPTPVPRGTHKSAVIVLLTDGENTAGPDPFVVAQKAADAGIRIYTIGVGTTSGATLHLDGFSVRSRLDETTLQQIAQLTDGAYYPVANAQGWGKIYDVLEREFVMKPQKMELTSLLAVAAGPLMLIGGGLSLFWFGRVP